MNNSTIESEVSVMYYTQEQIDRANQADLVSFLQSQGEQLTRAGNEYRWKRHDSLTVRGNKWYRHSQSKGCAFFSCQHFNGFGKALSVKLHDKINEDCYMTGFNTPSYFTKCFQKQFGILPKDFVK